MSYELHTGDCLSVMAGMASNSVDTILTDTPYGLGEAPDMVQLLQRWLGDEGHHDTGKGFMGKVWDSIPGPIYWREMYRVAKPGATLLAFGGTRTADLISIAIRLGGWQIKDCIMWVYGSGFCKVGQWQNRKDFQDLGIAEQWTGWGGSLKPAYEPIIVAMKPVEKTYSFNAQKCGVAGLNIDGCRVHIADGERSTIDNRSGSDDGCRDGIYNEGLGKRAVGEKFKSAPNGRCPANLIIDDSEEVRALFPDSIARPAKAVLNGGSSGSRGDGHSGWGMKSECLTGYDDATTSAARFFYCAKASRSERTCNGTVDNNHPTVKPLALLRYLAKLTATPTGGVVLDPFMGSGSTGVACLAEGRNFIGIDITPEYVDIARQRLEQATQQMVLV